MNAPGSTAIFRNRLQSSQDHLSGAFGHMEPIPRRPNVGQQGWIQFAELRYRPFGNIGNEG
jgi:hypothetical protein